MCDAFVVGQSREKGPHFMFHERYHTVNVSGPPSCTFWEINAMIEQPLKMRYTSTQHPSRFCGGPSALSHSDLPHVLYTLTYHSRDLSEGNKNLDMADRRGNAEASRRFSSVVPGDSVWQ